MYVGGILRSPGKANNEIITVGEYVWYHCNSQVSSVGKWVLHAEKQKEPARASAPGTVLELTSPFYSSHSVLVSGWHQRLGKEYMGYKPGVLSVTEYISAVVCLPFIMMFQRPLFLSFSLLWLNASHLREFCSGLIPTSSPREDCGSALAVSTVHRESLMLSSSDPTLGPETGHGRKSLPHRYHLYSQSFLSLPLHCGNLQVSF